MLGRAVLAAALAVSLAPLPVGVAWADEPAPGGGDDAALQLEPGTYVEHEAIAYVVDGAANEASSFSRSADLLAGAEDLMAVDASAAKEAGVVAAEDADASADAVPAAARARSNAFSGGDEPAGASGRLVLVRDESMTTDELVSALEDDPRVAFAEPNYVVEPLDDEQPSSEADAQDGAVQEASDAADSSTAPASDAAANPDEAAVSDAASDPESASGPEADSDAAAVLDAVASDTAAASNEAVASNAPADSGAAAASGAAASGSAASSDMTRLQWGMSNDGVLGGVSPDEAVDIGYGTWAGAAESGNWPEAKEAARSQLDTVVVAVIDTGVDESNPDLADVLWDGGDIPELTALGGDAHGLSLVPGTTSTAPASKESGHGTHVAGIIAAEWDGQGVSGVAPNVEIMSVRSEISFASEMIACINYVTEAARAGVNVRVANCSWGMGANASRAFDVAFTQLGREGVTAVFASGNSCSDMDATMNTISTLRDNPYVVVADSVDASGALSSFSCFGQATTDVVAPGSTILSTWPTSDSQYLGELDGDAAFYESFDEKTHADPAVGVGAGGQGSSGEDPEGGAGDGHTGGGLMLEFRYPSGEGVAVEQGGKRFDGSAALALDYDVEAAAAAGMGGYLMAQSSSLDLSGLEEKPRYLSIRVIGEGADGEACVPQVQIMVNTTDGQPAPITMASESSNLGDAWSAPFFKLPDNTNWQDFRIMILYMNMQGSMTGGQPASYPADGTVIVDSIGLGSDLVPYKYEQGTSMAAPAVSGAAAVMAGAYPDDSAAQLAARIKGAAKGSAYEGYCSTGGYATVDGGAHPAPTPVSAEASDDGATVTVRGYFASDGVRVSIGGAECAVLSRDDAAGGPGDGELVELTVQAPAGFTGGEQWVELMANGARGRMLAEFGDVGQGGDPSGDEPAYYDNANLPVPPELDDWSGWQLAGFAGDVYALPRSGEFNVDADYAFMLKYDPDLLTWSRVPLPSSEQRAAAGVGNVASVAGATYQGALIVQITSLGTIEGGAQCPVGSYWRYTADGAWEHIEVALPDEAAVGLSALGSDGEDLYVFGGMGTYGHSDASGAEVGGVQAILRLDLESGSAEQAGGLIKTRYGSTQVAYRDGAFLVSSGQNESAQDGTSMGVERVRVFREAQTALSPTGEMVEYPAGALSSIPVTMSAQVPETGQLAFAPAAVADGFMVVGPRSGSGAADTYELANQDGAQPTEYGKLASSQRLLSPSALAYDGALCVLAATTSDPYRIFSATAVETVAQPGDYVAPNPDPEPAPDGGDGGHQADLPGGLASTGDFPAPAEAAAAVVAAIAAAAAVGAACRLARRAKVRR